MQTTMKRLGSITLAAIVLAGTCMFSLTAKADVAEAAVTFKAKCAMCHGPDGKGKESMKTPDFTAAEVQKKSDADLSTAIMTGKGNMPAYKTMTPDQVKDMVAYIRSMKK